MYPSRRLGGLAWACWMRLSACLSTPWREPGGWTMFLLSPGRRRASVQRGAAASEGAREVDDKNCNGGGGTVVMMMMMEVSEAQAQAGAECVACPP